MTKYKAHLTVLNIRFLPNSQNSPNKTHNNDNFAVGALYVLVVNLITYHVHNMKIKTNIVAQSRISVVVSTSSLQNTNKLSSYR